MASSSADAHSQPRRPPPMARQSSTSSQRSHSPSESTQHKAKGPRQHVVGGSSRMQRNHSVGKNLNKLSKQAQAPGNEGNAVKHHRRAHSGNSTSAPSSPRPGIKRNASAGAVLRVGKHGHTASGIRKNHSSGHLPRDGGSRPALKASKSEIAPPKRSLINPGKAREPSPEDDHPTVHFDVADEEGQDDGWTEESASQSPTTTRSNTRSNSVVLDPHKAAEYRPMERLGGISRAEGSSQQASGTSSMSMRALPDRTQQQTRPANGSSTHHHSHSRPADADMITSRLLQRGSLHNPAPQMSAVAATVVSNHNEPRELSQSAGSTLVDTPGRDLVSRFIDGDGSAGTPNSSFLPSRNGSGNGNLKRNRSMPNVADEETPTRTPRRSGTSTPTDLPPSRTQQKLMLQRASSAIEPQKLIPSILPRTGGPTALYTGMTYSTNGEGRLDPRLQQQFNHVSVEYNVVRRYRNPLVEAIVRIEQMPGTPRKSRVPKSAGTNGLSNVHGGSSLSASYNDEINDSASRRSRVSFEHGRNSREEGDLEGRESFESDNGRIRNEVEELCRRLWESSEAAEHD
ncbi:uncharacterized protein N0V89_008284 [Didymosphaeria variabile]|uniref:TORC1 subunit TCO89 domain-containing protein n=1 Tax=Didymosphaeria variabile TaxID=1932322 RepID=A0A9W8XHA4_9PLEO|nr:uncharacterized protein N0V89_008284 [Didymosphaeria variabile]KAJ4349667.1 hypothetical protein N0V89_008284 [Didymosphaeria variabile]